MENNPLFIIVHCTDSTWGDAKAVNMWHKQRGWTGIGYNELILNGIRGHGSSYFEPEDGMVEQGRPVEEAGSHCVGYNTRSVGICLVGKTTFTGRQISTLIDRIKHYCDHYTIPVSNVLGHYETETGKHKTCPNLDMKNVRELCLNS